MCHNRLVDGTFYAFLLRIDDDLAAEAHATSDGRFNLLVALFVS